MNNFSITDSLIKLRDKNYDKNITKTIDIIIEKFDENQIKILSSYQGLKIDNNIIRLYFIENVGFRCINERDNLYGKLPVCNNIQNFMNKIYLEELNK